MQKMNFPTLLESLGKAIVEHHDLLYRIELGSQATYIAGCTKDEAMDAYTQLIDDLYSFHSQDLELCHFIAVGEDGKPMVKPYEGLFEVEKKHAGCTLLEVDPEHHNAPEDCRYYDKGKHLQAVKEFEAAEKRILFSGWEIESETESGCVLWFDDYRLELCRIKGATIFDQGVWRESKSVDKLVGIVIGLLPTQSAKQILNIKEDETNNGA